MATYAIGDIQGCFEPLQRLLDKLSFDPAVDSLWFAGDLINRGPHSLECLRYIKSLGDSALSVLGNHDLHALAVYYGGEKIKRKDTFQSILQAPDCEELMQWLLRHPLAYYDSDRNIFMSHAGLPPQWSVSQALTLAAELQRALRGPDAKTYFQNMYGNEPVCWRDDLTGLERLRCITNYFTRMRFLDAKGGLEFKHKEKIETAPPGYAPWFSYPRQDDATILFGHWAALQGNTGRARFVALDTGCVWGGTLRAVNLDTMEMTEVAHA
ncbi:symmetrical bis(5'-nucleosyl)-tetraphosphatase [Hahella aquimaris]|uniref:symmetrical bis(5'-nucleosyl)-tetraphosphatase n=1 Tax=Hahella sp. HNIBRBA332 TaxID=3015983 RepID=UPI00273B7EBC|nr:symmetrical bis(5'-nucleosyl)-tetraphosphatase [Hahella sp. HNIBRBA332]WLQ13902.1 symmetrical bis(5'-nucleosyl)-tetraphosphatase [Hahella sp. HNIBRBA332]